MQDFVDYEGANSTIDRELKDACLSPIRPVGSKRRITKELAIARRSDTRDDVLRVVRRWFIIANAVTGNVSDVVLGVAANPLAELLITLWRALRYRRSIVRSERMTEAKEMYERYSRNAGETSNGRVT